MGLSTGALGWLSLGVVLFLYTFGLAGGLWLIFYAIVFAVAFVTMLVYTTKEKFKSWRQCWAGTDMPSPCIGILKLVEEMKHPRPHLKMDKRMTGSSTIDDVLHEILNYTYRDYIQSWYRKISDDERFKYDMRLTLQRVIIALSERAKEIDLVPYLTTRLVDDFASHIRLYRRAVNKVREHQKDDTKPPADLESTFFDLECEMENNMCRDQVCLEEEGERDYLQDLSQVLMFLLLPQEDFHNKPFRYIVREVLVNGILLPTVNMVSDPDYLNQTISWLTKDSFFTNEYFLIILKTSDNIEELVATKEKVDVDIARQRSKDTGGHDDAEIKQQLSSLVYVKSVCEQRIEQLKEGVDTDADVLQGLELSKLLTPGQKLYSLPFDVVLNNNIALSYFIEYMTNIGGQHFLFFYLTVEGYRVSAEQQISAALLAENMEEKPDLEMLQEAALSIFNQYLSEKASPRIKIEEKLYRLIWKRIQHEDPTDGIFDEIQARVSATLQEDEQFFPAFRKSQIYIRLLAELNLLSTDIGKSDELLENQMNGSPLLSSKSNSLRASVENLETSSCDSNSSIEPVLKNPPRREVTLTAMIDRKGICREHGKQYAVYLITVTRHNADGSQDQWDVCRRYSDFHDLHMIVMDRYNSLSGLALPSKKTFNNMQDDFLEKRKVGLNAYLQTLLNAQLLKKNPGLFELVFSFLEHMVWEKEKSEVARKMDTVVKPLKNVSNFVRSMPDNFVDGVAKMSGGIKSIPNNMLDGVGKMLNVKGPTLTNIVAAVMSDLTGEPPQGMAPAIKAELMDSGKVGAGLEEQEEDDIPLRIMLLLMDEVFDLKNRNQWLRRRIVAILRQIVKTMFGESLNKKIVEQVETMTSADQITEYLKALRDAMWPSGTLAEPRPVRDDATQMRTRVVAKAKMLGTMSDELRHLLGSETTRHGVMRIFNMFQYRKLNRRLVYVILEGLLETIFPDNKFEEVFRKLHSRSSRVKQDSKKTETTTPSSSSSATTSSASSSTTTTQKTTATKRKR